MVLLGLTSTFAAFDLMMTLNHHWFSTIYGVCFWAGSIRASLSVCVLTVLAFHVAGYLRNTVTREHFHDMGKLMFGFTVFWAYVNFAQYFLIWYGNIPEETQWYIHRRHEDWYLMTILLPICHFAIPFFFLLPRSNKRNPLAIGLAATWILFFHGYDLYFQIMPESLKASVGDLPKEGWVESLSWVTFASVLFFIGVIVSTTLFGLRQAPLIPIRDPRVWESVNWENDEYGDVQHRSWPAAVWSVFFDLFFGWVKALLELLKRR
jgi:hypothetical protein